MYQNGSEVNVRGRLQLIVVFLGPVTSFCYWPHEIAGPNQNSVIQKCEPVVHAGCSLDLVLKMLIMTHYETLMTLIGYCIIANPP